MNRESDPALPEGELRRELEVNRALAGLSRHLVAADAAVAGIAAEVLDKSRALTRSEHGFVSFLDAADDANVGITLTRMLDACPLARSEADIRFPRGADGRYPGLWGHALNERRPFYTNAPGEHAASAGLPGGHVPVRNFLAVPVEAGGDLLGLVAVANGARPYGDDDLDAVGRIGDLYALALQRLRAEEARRSLEDRVHRAQRLESMGVLAAGVAHDFNNLLGTILLNADLAGQDLPAEADARRSLAEIRNASLRAASLCGQLLSYSGGSRIASRPLDISEHVRDMEALMRVSVPANVELRLDLGDALPGLVGDGAQVSQIVLNLVVNAVEALDGRDGSVVVATGTEEVGPRTAQEPGLAILAPAPGRAVFLDVRDDGPGMDETVLRMIFDPFYTTKFVGRGLGLAVVLGLVRSHGGGIRVRSRPGDGTTVRVFFPALDRPARKDPPPARGRPTEEILRPGAGGGTVLFVDDEPALLDTAEAMLRRAGFRVLAARDGIEALAACEEHREAIGAVVLDLTMPCMDGAECLREIRRRGLAIPAIVMSGYGSAEIRARLADLDVAGTLNKPFRMKDLVLELHRIGAASAGAGDRGPGVGGPAGDAASARV